MSRDQRARGRRRSPSSFRCRHCGLDVPHDAPGTEHRNHCPTCLWGDGEWLLVHRCSGCAAVHVNRIAGDDNPLILTRLAVRPLAQPPFPLELLSRV